MLYCYIQTDSTVKLYCKEIRKNALDPKESVFAIFNHAIFCVRKESKELYRITFLYNLITAARQIIIN